MMQRRLPLLHADLRTGIVEQVRVRDGTLHVYTDLMPPAMRANVLELQRQEFLGAGLARAAKNKLFGFPGGASASSLCQGQAVLETHFHKTRLGMVSKGLHPKYAGLNPDEFIACHTYFPPPSVESQCTTYSIVLLTQ